MIKKFVLDVDNYINKSLDIRQQHLNLKSPCNERGGTSTHHKGVLSQYLNTPIYGKPCDLCHACHNAKCSNPEHLYWGTRKENTRDAINNGTFLTPWERLVEKHGYEKACKLQSKGNPSKGGSANKGKSKSTRHKENISSSLKNKKR